jgi:hypothetical protein
MVISIRAKFYEILIEQQSIDAVVPKPQVFMSSSGLIKINNRCCDRRKISEFIPGRGWLILD